MNSQIQFPLNQSLADELNNFYAYQTEEDNLIKTCQSVSSRYKINNVLNNAIPASFTTLQRTAFLSITSCYRIVFLSQTYLKKMDDLNFYKQYRNTWLQFIKTIPFDANLNFSSPALIEGIHQVDSFIKKNEAVFSEREWEWAVNSNEQLLIQNKIKEQFSKINDTLKKVYQSYKEEDAAQLNINLKIYENSLNIKHNNMNEELNHQQIYKKLICVIFQSWTKKNTCINNSPEAHIYQDAYLKILQTHASIKNELQQYANENKNNLTTITLTNFIAERMKSIVSAQ